MFSCRRLRIRYYDCREPKLIAKSKTHFREVSQSLPFFKRIKVLHLTPFELPRTATRKVKRREVIEELQRLEAKTKGENKFQSDKKADGNVAWLCDIVATVANRPRSEVSSRFKV